jgi:cysteine-rich repeat protein
MTKPLLSTTILLAACAVQPPSAGQVEQDARISGAIFTTTVDGSRVDANIYAAKADVYLDGGPGPGAPASAAALPEGDYYFQVTNPNGRDLLSLDGIDCREVHVNASGVIDAVIRANGCEHATGIDRDHAELGAITVQLMPYADTPNPGGEYKVWMTPVDLYDATFTRTHGFVLSDSKTDNFKVRVELPPPPPGPVCGNGIVETGEMCDDGALDGTAGDLCASNCTLLAPPVGPVCGNGVVEAGEECDDGALNGTAGDDCSVSCQLLCAHPQ